MGVSETSSMPGDPSALERLARFGGPALVDRLVRLFLAETPRRIATAVRALDANDLSGVRETAHLMRSSCGQLGAPMMHAITSQIETATEQEMMRERLRDLEREFDRYRNWVLAQLPESGKAA